MKQSAIKSGFCAKSILFRHTIIISNFNHLFIFMTIHDEFLLKLCVKYIYINNIKFLAWLVMCTDEITSSNFLPFLRSCRSYRIDPPSAKKSKRLSHLTAPWKLSDLLAVILELASLGRKIRKLFRGRLLVSRLLLQPYMHGTRWRMEPRGNTVPRNQSYVPSMRQD